MFALAIIVCFHDVSANAGDAGWGVCANVMTAKNNKRNNIWILITLLE
jgi:hypothetical protein